MSDFLTHRGAMWHFVRRVPAEFAALDRRCIIRHSTRIRVSDEQARAEVFVVLAQSIGRNDPCFCNSEQKFKKCCGPLIDLNA